MSVFLSPVGGAAAQFLDDSGIILSGGKIYTYAAGTTTPLATYIDSEGVINHTNPIVLNAAGRVPTGEVWLTEDTQYKFIVKDSNDVLIATYDDISGINDATNNASLVEYDPPYNNSVATNVEAKLAQYPSIDDFGAVGDGVTDDKTAFDNADFLDQPIYVPNNTYYTTTVPTNKYFGPGIIKVLTENFYLDHAIPTKLVDGLSSPTPDPEEDTGTRFFNLIAGQNSGASMTSDTARATTIFGSEALMLDSDPVRATGFGKQVFKNITDVYASDAFGADAIGQGDFVTRCAGFGSNTLKWAGSTNPVAVLHDYYRYLDPINNTGDFITATGMDAPNRWPTIRAQFVGSITAPDPARIPSSSAQVSQSVAMGRNALLHSLKTDANVAIGVNAMAYALDNAFNVAVGTRALRDTVSGNRNTAVGNNAGIQNISGFNNVAVGFSALALGSHTANNVVIGADAATALTGTNVAPSPTPTARRNVFIGSNAGEQATDGAFNIGIGSFSLANTSAGNNTAIGASAMAANTTGERNTAVGFGALTVNTTGRFNVALGMSALDSNTTASENTAVGYEALSNNTVGTQNTALGYQSLRFTQSGGSHIGFNNCTGVGYDTRISTNNQVQLGNSATTTFAYGAVQNRSDLRDKADVKDISLGLDFINSLRPVDYKWDMRDDYFEEYEHDTGRVDDEGKPIYEKRLRKLNKDGSKKRSRFHHGLIAQEVKATCEKLGVDFGGYQDHSVNGGDDVLSLGYEELIAPLIKAVQELAAKIEVLSAK
jgi:hypothetical protein